MTQDIDLSNDNKINVSEIALYEFWNMLASRLYLEIFFFFNSKNFTPQLIIKTILRSF